MASVSLTVATTGGGMVATMLKRKEGRTYVFAANLRNEATRNKTRFQVTAAALNQDIPPAAFTPAGLAEKLAAPAVVTRIAP